MATAVKKNGRPARTRAHAPSAFIDDGELVLTNFRESDPEVLALVEATGDPEAAVHRCLAFGAHALRLAQVSLDSAVVEKAFGEMSTSLDASLKDFNREISEKADELFADEDGELGKTLTRFRDEVDKILGETFDPDGKKSALAKLDAVLVEAGQQEVLAVRRLIDPDNEISPLNRYREEIVQEIAEHSADVTKAVTDLGERLGVAEARAEVEERTTGKGFTFEELVYEAVNEIASAHEDVAERVGGSPGFAGSKKGDIVVELTKDDTNGHVGRYVIEAKAQKLTLKKILEELDVSIENRGALAGIAVFSRDELNPVALPFDHYDNKAIVVFDKDSQDDLALRLACCWARWIARRRLSGNGEAADLERIADLLELARKGLTRATKIKTALGTSTKKIDAASSEIDGLVADVEAALDAIATEVAC